uniref:Uncharacterized protein n=1 Tax=Guillardia theta TaxID=55529 RepID=A0A7S4NU25_GUITH|mmetsp:Transcript_32374/g.102792  ORF Transcript_32374/g.102792 Transcript_32374/m.102792 type:complete len:141 (+) Transcript_32374:264-686(+)
MKLFKRIAKVATKSKKDNTDVVAPLAKPASEQDTKVIAKPLPSGVVASAVVQDEETRQDPSVQQGEQAPKVREDVDVPTSRQATPASTTKQDLTEELEQLKQRNLELKQKNKFLINLLAVSELDEETLRNELKQLQGVKS